MATGNKQAGEWMSPGYGDIGATMKDLASLRKTTNYSHKPHGPDDTSWIQDDVGPGSCKPMDVFERYGRNGG